MKLIIPILLISSLNFNACHSKKEENKDSIVQNQLPKEEPVIKEDSTFFKIIKELEEINFFVEGEDSIVVTNNPEDLIELNGIKSVFYNPFDSTDTGLVKYKKVERLRKFNVKKKMGNKANPPSATIIQLSFKNLEDAKTWFDTYDKSFYKSVIENKPKKSLWLDKNKVYFVQTYWTPTRKPLNLIKTTLIEKLKKYETIKVKE